MTLHVGDLFYVDLDEWRKIYPFSSGPKGLCRVLEFNWRYREGYYHDQKAMYFTDSTSGEDDPWMLWVSESKKVCTKVYIRKEYTYFLETEQCSYDIAS